MGTLDLRGSVNRFHRTADLRLNKRAAYRRGYYGRGTRLADTSILSRGRHAAHFSRLGFPNLHVTVIGMKMLRPFI